MVKKVNTQPKRICTEEIVDFLVEKKVSKVFDLTGGMIAFIEDAISKKKGIECFPMHHEQAAGFAAEGYARESGNFGVAIATSGPGATNLMTAIGSCYFDSIPALFITGQVNTENLKKHENIRQEGFQETDVAAIVKTITKYAVLVKDPLDVIYELEKAYYIMKEGRQGPVLVDIPINFQRTVVDKTKLRHFFGSDEHKKMDKNAQRYKKTLDVKKIKDLEKALKASRAPIVLVGHGVRLSDQTEALKKFVTSNNLPVVSSLMGLDAFPDSKFFVGYIGSNGNRNANIALANADLIIALGTRLDIRQTGDPKFFNAKATIVHVDIDQYSINYTIPSALSFETDLGTFFAATKNIRTEAKHKWITFIKDVSNIFRRELPYSKTINPNTFINELSQRVRGKSIIVADVGQNQQWCAQSWKVKNGQRVLFSGGMGAMGFSLPAAIGAWCASPKKDLIVVTGDGGFQINIQEMETVSRNKIPMKLFVLNNQSLGMVREFQDLYFNKNYQSTVKGYGNPDFKKLASAYNFQYVKMTTLKKNDGVLKKILEETRPVLIEVVIPIDATLTPKIVYGHALDDQAPYLDEKQKHILETLKAELRTS